MRYVPSTGSRFVLQVPEDKNSYINVKNLDARGLSTVFEGKISNGVASGSENQLTINEIQDDAGLTFDQYRPVLSAGIEIQMFAYANVGLGSGSESTSVGVNSLDAVGINFSDKTSTSTEFVGPLKYYIFGYDVETGKMPNAVTIVGEDPEYNAILDPSKWNEDQYFEIGLTRTSTTTIPIIYRVWNGNVEFLGLIGNNKIGTGSLSFKDFGNRQIPSWNQNEIAWSPSFLEDVIQIIGGVPVQRKKIIGKELLKIKPITENSAPNYIIAETIAGGNLANGTDYQIGNTVKFIIDDTARILEGLSLASAGNIKELFFPAGTYNIRDIALENSSFVDYSNISLRGVGESSVIKRLPSHGSNNTFPCLLSFSGTSSKPVQGLRFRSIVFDGNKEDNASVSPAGGGYEDGRYISEGLVFLSRAENITVTECRFIDAAGPGVHSEFSTSVLLNQNIFSRLGRNYETTVRPVEVFETDNNIVQGNIFEFCTAGPYFFGVEFSTINNNIVRSCGDDGVVLETSYQWSATNNLSYSDSDSLIKSVDQYNNEYSKAPIEVRRGTALEPIFFTVTNGGEAVGLAADSIQADIYKLNVNGSKSSTKVGSFKVNQTSDQLEAGIFSVTLPGNDSGLTTTAGLFIPGTGGLSLLDPDNNQYGYMYEISATAFLGGGGRGFVPVSVAETTIGSTEYLSIKLRNTSDMLSFIAIEEGFSGNDFITITDFTNANEGINTLKDNAYQISSIDTNTNSVLILPVTGVTPGSGVDFSGGSLFIRRENYQIADGNIIVH